MWIYKFIGEDYRAKKTPDEWYLDLEQLTDNRSVAQVVRNEYTIKCKNVYIGNKCYINDICTSVLNKKQG